MERDLLSAVNNLLEVLCVEICERMQITCSSVKAIEKNKYEEIKKPHKLNENSIMKDNVSTPLQKRLDIFIFSMICLIVAIFFFKHCESLVLTILVAPEIYLRWHNKIIYGIFLITT